MGAEGRDRAEGESAPKLHSLQTLQKEEGEPGVAAASHPDLFCRFIIPPLVNHHSEEVRKMNFGMYK